MEEEDADIDEITTGEREDVAQTEVENSTLTTQSAASKAGNGSECGVDVTYAANGVTSFNKDSLAAGQVWVDKSVSKTETTETSFEETLSVYASRYTYESTYEKKIVGIYTVKCLIERAKSLKKVKMFLFVRYNSLILHK